MFCLETFYYKSWLGGCRLPSSRTQRKGWKVVAGLPHAPDMIKRQHIYVSFRVQNILPNEWEINRIIGCRQLRHISCGSEIEWEWNLPFSGWMNKSSSSSCGAANTNFLDSLAICHYHLSLPTSLPDDILCPHRAVVDKFLIVKHLHVRVMGSVGESHLWVHTNFSSSVSCPIRLIWIVLEMGGWWLWDVAASICSI